MAQRAQFLERLQIGIYSLVNHLDAVLGLCWKDSLHQQAERTAMLLVIRIANQIHQSVCAFGKRNTNDLAAFLRDRRNDPLVMR